jgi:hypothetical protein
MRQNHDTGAWLLAQYAGATTLARETVVGPDGIGALTSFYQSIDGVPSAQATGRPRFTMRETLDLWQALEQKGSLDASARLRKATSFRALFEGPSSNPIVTVAEFRDGHVVVDGNHTAVSALMCATAQKEGPVFTLLVYVLTMSLSMTELA